MKKKRTSEDTKLRETKVIQDPTIGGFLKALPDELILKILACLPVRSLLKFSQVSKQWRSLISNPQFIKSHLKLSTENYKLEHHMVLGTQMQHGQIILKQCSLRSLLNEQVVHGVNLILPMDNPGPSIQIVGCCNGLICIILRDNEFFLWNPGMRKVKKLPDVDDGVGNASDFRVLFCGFGYDEDSDDYKVMGSFRVENGSTYQFCKVYSLRTNLWKNVAEIVVKGPYYDFSGKFLNGNLYWAKNRDYLGQSTWDIVSFDLRAEVNGTVERPQNFVNSYGLPFLKVLDGCLSVVGYNHEARCTDVWALRQDGVTNSWYKMQSLPCYGIDCIWPLFIAPTGELLGTSKQRLFIDDPKTKSIRQLRTVNFDFSDVVVYTESLVSPFPDGDHV